jgi:phage pi2 protein 07
VSPVKYELGFYIPEDDILHSHYRENLKSYIALTGWTMKTMKKREKWVVVRDTTSPLQSPAS